jgi:hypothetical protein
MQVIIFTIRTEQKFSFVNCNASFKKRLLPNHDTTKVKIKVYNNRNSEMGIEINALIVIRFHNGKTTKNNALEKISQSTFGRNS